MRGLLLRQLAELTEMGGMGPLQRLRALWGVLVDAELAQRSRPLSIDGSRLVVGVDNSTVAQELQLSSARLLQVLRKHDDILHLPGIDQVVTRSLPRSTSPPAPVAAESVMPKRAPAPSKRVDDALESVQDPELQARLRRLARTRE